MVLEDLYIGRLRHSSCRSEIEFVWNEGMNGAGESDRYVDGEDAELVKYGVSSAGDPA